MCSVNREHPRLFGRHHGDAYMDTITSCRRAPSQRCCRHVSGVKTERFLMCLVSGGSSWINGWHTASAEMSVLCSSLCAKSLFSLHTGRLWCAVMCGESPTRPCRRLGFSFVRSAHEPLRRCGEKRGHVPPRERRAQGWHDSDDNHMRRFAVLSRSECAGHAMLCGCCTHCWWHAPSPMCVHHNARDVRHCNYNHKLCVGSLWMTWSQVVLQFVFHGGGSEAPFHVWKSGAIFERYFVDGVRASIAWSWSLPCQCGLLSSQALAPVLTLSFHGEATRRQTRTLVSRVME